MTPRYEQLKYYLKYFRRFSLNVNLLKQEQIKEIFLDRDALIGNIASLNGNHKFSQRFTTPRIRHISKVSAFLINLLNGVTSPLCFITHIINSFVNRLKTFPTSKI